MASTKTYLWQTLAVVLVSVGLAAGINYLVDPYLLFGTNLPEGINKIKPKIADRVRVAKPYMADRFDAVTVIAGNSRPEMGVNPSSRCWAEEQKPVFNASLPGASFRLQTLAALDAFGNKPALLVLGLDFTDFVVPGKFDAALKTKPVGRTPDESRLHIPGVLENDLLHHAQRIKDHLDSLFSLTALMDSIHTMAVQRHLNASTRTPDGFNPANDYLDIIRSEGQYVLFKQKNLDTKRQLSREFYLPDWRVEPSSAFAQLDRVIKWTRTHGVALQLFINPYHLDYLASIMEAGHWAMFEKWKHELVAMSTENRIPIWDFNSVDHFSTEPAPSRGDTKTVLKWFWEPSHYRMALGDLMLQSMMGRPCVPELADRRFGVPLEPGNLDSHLNALRTGVLDRMSTGK